MSERLPCADCSLRSIEQSDRSETCSSFVQKIIHEWWHGNPTVELYEAAMDHFVASHHAGETFGSDERDSMDNCLDEHASARCESLNPY